MEYKHFTGIDISKNTLDVALVTAGILKTHIRIPNTVKGIRTAVPKLLKDCGAKLSNTLFCMESTGMYNRPVLQWLQSKNANIWVESGYQIKQSLGATRGKNDKVDSGRIAMYAFTHRHKARKWRAPSPVIQQLSAMLSQRTRLLKAKLQIQTTLTEQKKFLDKSITQSLEKYTSSPLKTLRAQVKAIEMEIKAIIRNDEQLRRLYKIVSSVNGVGFLTAAHILATTQGFESFTDAKKYACYAGVVPFEYSSGSSYKSKGKVSQRANKTIKTLLHIAAKSSIRAKGELQDYYKRKIAEGKNKMSVLNAIRNKIVLRVFACVKRNELYEEKRSYVPGK